MPTKGPTLRRERRAADITATALAVQMGLSRQALWAMEQAAVVTPDRVVAHREAVKTLRDAREDHAA